MERLTISLEEDLAQQFQEFISGKGYKNRSEAVRDLIREKLETERKEQATGHCIGTLSYVFDHNERELARRLTQEHHHHHDLSVSTLHVHLDHDNCLEVVVLKGKIENVEHFSNQIITQPGVRHGKLYLVPVDIDKQTHHHGHEHIQPKS